MGEVCKESPRYMGKTKVVLASGSFDPLHIGHIAYLKAARKLGDVLVVAIKGNERLKAKKKRHFMSEGERKTVLESLRYIDKVVVIDSPEGEGMVAIQAIPFIQPDVYATGESIKNLALEKVCKAHNVKIKYGVGGKRIRSSTELLKEYYNTPWEK